MKNIFERIDKGNKANLLKMLESSIFTYQKDVYITNLFVEHNILAIVLTGSIDIYKEEFDGDKHYIDTYEENEVFGSILTGINTREYTLHTTEDTKLLLIDFNSITKESTYKKSYYIQFIKNVLEIYNEAIEKRNRRIEIISQKTIRNKLLEFFKYEVLQNHSRVIYIRRTYSALADHLAIDRSAMSRELHNLEEDGLISIKGKRITLLYEA